MSVSPPCLVCLIAADLDNYTNEVLDKLAEAGIDVDALTSRLLEEGAESFVKSGNDLRECISSKSEALKAA